MKILLLDNYDSFTYNLVHIIKAYGYGAQLDVIRNDKIKLEDVAAYDKILLSPGPGIPEDAGIMIGLIKAYAASKSILGICLGHQAICEVFGAKLRNMDVVVHGKGILTTVTDASGYLFEHVSSPFITGRYHSWVAEGASIIDPLIVTAVSEDNYIMGVRHINYDVQGLQFHPESILTVGGKQILKNWLEHGSNAQYSNSTQSDLLFNEISKQAILV